MAGGRIARMSRRIALLAVPALHLGLASCATNPVTGGQDFVLNGLYPKGEPVAGRTLKIVQ